MQAEIAERLARLRARIAEGRPDPKVRWRSIIDDRNATPLQVKLALAALAALDPDEAEQAARGLDRDLFHQRQPGED